MIEERMREIVEKEIKRQRTIISTCKVKAERSCRRWLIEQMEEIGDSI